MTIIAGISIDAADFAIGQVLAHSTTRIVLTQFVPTDGRLAPYFWKEFDGDPTSFEQQVRADGRVASLESLDGRADAHLYRIEWTDLEEGLLAAVRDHDVVVEAGRTTGEGDKWRVRLRAEDQAGLTGFQQACHDHDIPFTVDRVYHDPDTATGAFLDLTPEQSEALLLAIREGYFDVPRDVTLADLGEHLGISRQAFSRRLVRAQRHVFQDLYWTQLGDT